MTFAIILFIVGAIIFFGGIIVLFKGKHEGLVILIIGAIICVIWGGKIKSNTQTIIQPKHQTVVLFDNGNNQIDTLVFESDTIHANANNIW